ncbi:MAG: hypothetical protein N2B03_05845 [Boseongicola sp.]
MLLSLLSVSACVEWPDVNTPLASRGTASWPELQPISDLPASATTSNEATNANAALQARAAALRRRAILMRRTVTDQTDFDRLRAALAQ